MESSNKKGDRLENQVYDLILKLLDEDNFIAPKKQSKVFKKKGYYSSKRKGDIIFDVTIETTLPNADKYSILIVIECKNLGRKVEVSDIEEFSKKLSQIGEHNTKGIVISTNTFQKSAYDFAKSENIGLARINSSDEIQWINYRKDNSQNINDILNEEEKEFTDEFCNQNSFVATLNFNKLMSIADLLIELSVIDRFINGKDLIKIPYISHDKLNSIVNKLYNYNLYNDYALNFDKLTSFLEPLYNVTFKYDTLEEENYLGKIEFNPLCIKISKNARIDNNRWRFTLAHEIGHLILHYNLLKDWLNEKEDDDLSLALRYSDAKRNFEKLEIQANLFASYLLLPEKLLKVAINTLFDEYRIHRRCLYLDNQPVNQKEVYEILGILSNSFQVSIEAIKIRLIKLNLLEDETDYSLKTLLKKYFGK
ncbi:MAG: ImmA/IrrE family metallo-endopeptidase [Bacteroidales bacterium]|jgi:Zn-dependent peptidase ImmA (M78 family)|nr:ImmA/IrrE family metallo-endopeptidase [Bacteroidales bacterium]